MRIFYAFIVIVIAVLSWLLPITDSVYDFRTDQRTDDFTVETAVATITANVTLLKFIYGDDTQTLSLTSSLATDMPTFVSYNTTTRAVAMSGLTANTTRLISASYDVDALNGSAAINTLANYIPFIWMLCIVGLPMAALFAIFTGRAGV